MVKTLESVKHSNVTTQVNVSFRPLKGIVQRG